MRCATAAWWRLLFCKKVDGQLPTRHLRPCVPIEEHARQSVAQKMKVAFQNAAVELRALHNLFTLATAD